MPPSEFALNVLEDEMEIPGIVDRDPDDLMEPAYLVDRDPRCVVFRTVHPDSGARRSIIFFREDVVPAKRELRRM